MRLNEIEDCLHKQLTFSKTFPAGEPDDFAGLWAAEDWVRSKGYSTGSHERHHPIALAHGDADIAKWTHIDFWERHKLDGVIIPGPGGFRGGSAIVLLEKDPDTLANEVDNGHEPNDPNPAA